MTLKIYTQTTCPVCNNVFDIHENRAHKIRNGNVIWFYDAVNQFENHKKVQCPNCNNCFEAPEAKLFGVFNSAYTTIIAGWLFILVSIGVIFGVVFVLEKLGIL